MSVKNKGDLFQYINTILKNNAYKKLATKRWESQIWFSRDDLIM